MITVKGNDKDLALLQKLIDSGRVQGNFVFKSKKAKKRKLGRPKGSKNKKSK